MAHELFRVLDSVFNVPHLVTTSALRPIVEYLQSRSFGDVVPQAASVNKREPEQFADIGEINIEGVITYKPIQGLCGPSGVSYKGILEQAEMLIDSGVKTLIMTHDSPGGAAMHCFSTANDLRALCDENGVRLISYIDTQSASASLALGIVADEVIIHPSASTGSVGCVVALADRSKAYEMAGIKPIYIASTEGKTPFQSDGSFSQDFLDGVQEDVTRLGLEFAQHVHKYSGIPLDDILAMDAKMFHAQAALDVGLVNKIMDHKQFTAYIAELHKGQ